MKKPAQAFSLIELIVVVALISLFVVPLIVSLSRTGQTQNIKTSVAVLAGDFQLAKTSARSARDKTAWGVISTSENSYEVVGGTPASHVTDVKRKLETGVTFVNQFSIWFEIGTGNVANEKSLKLINTAGQKYELIVNELGTVSTQKL